MPWLSFTELSPIWYTVVQAISYDPTFCQRSFLQVSDRGSQLFKLWSLHVSQPYNKTRRTNYLKIRVFTPLQSYRQYHIVVSSESTGTWAKPISRKTSMLDPFLFCTTLSTYVKSSKTSISPRMVWADYTMSSHKPPYFFACDRPRRP